MPVKVYLLLFRKGYHVGWREPRELVDHTTVLRALVYLAHLTGSDRCFELIKGGKLEASALLPTLPIDGNYVRLLAPFPYLPCLGKASEIRRLYLTLPALSALVEFADRCHNTEGVPVVGISYDGSIVIQCVNAVKEVRALILRRVEGIACLDGDDCAKVKDYAIQRFIETISEYRNRIDRVTGAADLFTLYGKRPRTPLWLALHGEEEALKCAGELLKILEYTGIGGLRSRGWGLFTLLEEVKLSSWDQSIINKVGWAPGLVYLLGTMPPGTWLRYKFSYANRYVIMGRAGPPTGEYKLPVLEVMDVGSLVYVESIPKSMIIPLDGGKAVYIFNPVVLHAG